MAEANVEVAGPSKQSSSDPLPFARCYQLEALEKGRKQNTIVYLETGAGKTLIAIMLLRSYAYLLRKPSRSIAVFLVPKVVLVSQQADAIKTHTDFKVGMYWGEMGVDFWSAATWRQQIEKHEVLVMTPDILLNGLRHSFFKMEMIKVLIFDECHHARGNHAYALIMTQFYHYHVKSGASEVPRIFGMTASLIHSKGGNSESDYWKNIHELETRMHSKVYTCASEAVVSKYIPSSTVKVKSYQELEKPDGLHAHLKNEIRILGEMYHSKLGKLDLEKAAADATRKKISKMLHTFIYCVDELGIWLAFKAADLISRHEVEDSLWVKLDLVGERIVKDLCCDVFEAFSTSVPSDPKWTIGEDIKGNMACGLIAAKVVCLFESLLEYSHIKDIRCIIFVERIVTAMVLPPLLNELLQKHNGWKAKYIAGNSSVQSQSRKHQSAIVEEFREGQVNVIVSTSILEEGLDVQSCNLVVRFDPSVTVSSFIQSRGRARMQNSDFLLMVNSGDSSMHSRMAKFLASGDVMRNQSLLLSSLSCEPLEDDLSSEEVYRVESTGAIVTLSSSVCLLHFYCSRLPSDGYFKPTPKFDINEEMSVCTLYLPKSSPIPPVCVHGNLKTLKKRACFEACKQLHKVHALTDDLIPDIVVEEDAQGSESEPYDDVHLKYFAPELVNHICNGPETLYRCYTIELVQGFHYDVQVQDIVLATRIELETDIISTNFELLTERGTLKVKLRYVGDIKLEDCYVRRIRRFQSTLLRVLLDRSVTNLMDGSNGFSTGSSVDIDYLLLPSAKAHQKPNIIDWEPPALSELFPSVKLMNRHTSSCSLKGRSHDVWTRDGLVCRCMLEHSLVYTPHNGRVYCIDGFFTDLNANSHMKTRDGTVTTYKKYYEERHDIKLSFEKQSLVRGRHIFLVQNCLQCRLEKEKGKEPTSTVELPPELCSIVISPLSINTVYSFSFLPSIMHRLEALLLASNLKRVHLHHSVQDAVIPTVKVLEAITTKKCHEQYHLESLEALGDSFLKYAISQQLFKSHQDHHEGLLSVKRERVISNAALCKLGCACKLPGFIRNEPFDPKSWFFPGFGPQRPSLGEELLSGARKVYVVGRRKIKSKRVADVVEALLGAYISTAGEMAGIMFLGWLGIKADFTPVPYRPNFSVNPEKIVDIKQMEVLLNYSFREPSLVVEALTHGSYMLSEIPTCYQRLEFLGDAVLDYVITIFLYSKYPGMSPGLLTDLRSASVNNDCYALSSLKAGLHKHLLHASQMLHRHIVEAIKNFEKHQEENSSLEFTFGWQSETSFPKVLGDVIESLAGAIFVDSGYNKEAVFNSIKPLLEPMITLETLRLHPVRELNEFCQKQQYIRRKPVVSRGADGVSVTVEVETPNGIYKETVVADDKNAAKRTASRRVFTALKEAKETASVCTGI